MSTADTPDRNPEPRPPENPPEPGDATAQVPPSPTGERNLKGPLPEVLTSYPGHIRDEVGEVVAEVHRTGRSAFRFLKSLWFWLIAAPVNLVILAGLTAFLAPHLFVGFPPAPPGLESYDKAVVIDKDRQAAYGYELGKLKYRWIILTGRKEHDTPVGRFRVTRKIADYRSREFNGARMPNSLFFIDSRGIAMHASSKVTSKWFIKQVTGNLPNIGSYGCVRFTSRGSERMFEWADIGTPVWVMNLRGGGSGDEAEGK